MKLNLFFIAMDLMVLMIYPIAYIAHVMRKALNSGISRK